MCLDTREGTDRRDRSSTARSQVPALQQLFSDLTPPHLKLRCLLPLTPHHNADGLGHEESASCSEDRPTGTLGLGQKPEKSPRSVTLFGRLLTSKLHYAHGGTCLTVWTCSL